jgi:hypothetical protein
VEAGLEIRPVVIMPRMHRHKWNYHTERHLAGSNFPDGNARTERDCMRCGITMITVIPSGSPPRAWHEWRAKDGKKWVGETRPPCLEESKPTEL